MAITMKDYIWICQATAGWFSRPLAFPGKGLPPSFLQGYLFNRGIKTGTLITMPMTVQHEQAQLMIVLTLKHSKPAKLWTEHENIRLLIVSFDGMTIILNIRPF